MRTSPDWPTLGRKTLEECLQGRRPPGDSTAEGECYHCPTSLLAEAARTLHSKGSRLVSLAATLEADGEATMTYTFCVGDNKVLALEASSVDKTVDSLFSLFSTADFLEREVSHLFGIKFVGHPNLATPPNPPTPSRDEPEGPRPSPPRPGSGRRNREAPS